ncbi:MAG: glycerate kinase [Dissulfurispiraceae bacterium]|jgi:glycerate-2-kinase|nr:glycerate kinase [Dissulfurispiraceae bacterium]
MKEGTKQIENIFRKILDNARPELLTTDSTKNIIKQFQSGRYKILLPIAFGKAACLMAKGFENAVSGMDFNGICLTKYDHAKDVDIKKFRIHEAGHPLPDQNGVEATSRIIKSIKEADEQTFIVLLISGGGSSLLISPAEGLTLEDKQAASDLLMRAGADIVELNTVRKHLSGIKGGRLAELAYPARIVSLILSDVIGDRLDTIASGPAYPDSTTFDDALSVIKKYDLHERIPDRVIERLYKGAEGLVKETPKQGMNIFDNVENMVIGSNRILVDAAKKIVEDAGIAADIFSYELTGEAADAGRMLAQRARQSQRNRCIISGGETTVNVKGKGLGGRNMELALSFAIGIDGAEGITMLSAGTDGTDGPTDAAGAIVDGSTVANAGISGIDAQAYLDNNDSYNFFKKAGGLLITGPTGTNLMDLQLVVVQ